jgi:pimeloyl-ACP methyl ester carboxylesterase
MQDWASAYRFQPARASLAAIGVPTLVGWGENSHPAARRANQLLAQCTGACVVTLRGAAHFMIATHAAEVACALAQHVTAHAGAKLRLSA